MTTDPHLPPPVADLLRRYRRRRFTLDLIRAVLAAISLNLVLALVVMHVDRIAFLSQDLRLALSWACHGLVAVLLFGWCGWRLRRAPSLDALAYAIEARHPALQERLVTLAAINGQSVGDATRAALIDQLTTETTAGAASLRERDLAPWTRVRMAAVAFLAVATCYCALALVPSYQFPLMVERFLAPGRNLPKPSFLNLTVTPEAAVLGQGDDLVLQVEVDGELPALLSWFYARIGLDPSICRVALGTTGDTPDFTGNSVHELSRVQRRLFVWTRRELDQDLTLRIRHGDAQTAVHTVTVVAQPRVLDLAVDLVPPAYSGLPQQTVAASADAIQALVGSEATIRFRADRAVATQQLRIVGRDEPIQPEWDADALHGTWTVTIERDLAIEVHLVDERGFANREPARVSITARADAPPVVRLDEPVGEISRSPGELIPVRALISDDLALRSAAFRYQLNPQLNPDATVQELAIPLPDQASIDTVLALAETFDLERSGALPGDELVLYLRARDSAGQDGISAGVTIRVVALVRGADERRRIAVLGVLVDLLASADGDLMVTPAALPPLRERATTLGIRLPEVVDRSALLALVEREHHLTAAPRHQADLRALHALMMVADEDGRRKLSEHLLPTLIDARAGANLVAGLLGLQAEARALHAAISAVRALGDGEDAAARRAPLQRRGRLFLTTAQDLGVDILALLRRRAAATVDASAQRIGDINTAAYQLNRAGTPRSLESCLEIERLIDVQVRELLPELALAHAAAAQLRSSLAAQALALSDQAPVRTAAIRLLGREPFAATAVELALVGGRQPTEPAMMARDHGLTWEAALLARQTRIPAADLRVALALLALERGTASDLSAVYTGQEPAPLPDLVPAIHSDAHLPEPSALLTLLSSRLQALDLALGAATGTADVAAALTAWQTACDRVTASLALSLRLERLEHPAAGEELLVRLRAAILRWRQQTAAALVLLLPEAGGDAAVLAGRGEAVTTVTQANQGMAAALATATARFTAGESGAPGLPVLADLARARELVAIATAPATPAERAQRLLASDPAAADALLAAQQPLAQRLHDVLLRLGSGGDKPDRATARSQAHQLVERLDLALQQAADHPLATPLRQNLDAVRTALAASNVADAARAQLGVTEAVSASDRLRRRLLDADGDRRTAAAFSGGPDLGDLPLARADAALVRDRWRDLDRHARRTAIAALLAGDDAAAAQAVVWARTGYRLLLSELAGPPAARTAGGGQPPSDRLRDWLRREIAEARREAMRADGLRHYRAPTLEYLGAIDDFLRY